MLHSTVVELLEKHGAWFLPLKVYESCCVGIIGEHYLGWYLDPWTNRIANVRYYQGEKECTCQLAWPEERVANGTLVKRFIQRAVSKRWWVNGVQVEYGPDASHRKLAPSLRANYTGRPGPRCNVRTAEGLVMGQQGANGECPPQVLLDWLKESGHLLDVA